MHRMRGDCANVDAHFAPVAQLILSSELLLPRIESLYLRPIATLRHVAPAATMILALIQK